MTKADWDVVKAEIRSPVQRWPTFGIVLIDLIAFTLSAWLRHQGRVAAIGSVLVLALALHHAYLLLHEATHASIAKRKWINALVGHVCGWLIGLPYLSRQRSHMLHHAWAGHPEGDPANKRVIERFAVMSDRQANRLERVWRSWLPLLSLNERLGLWLDPFRRHRVEPKLARYIQEIHASRLYLFAYFVAVVLLCWGGMLADFASWYLPAWAIQLTLDELVNLPHHAETPLLARGDAALPLWEQHRVTHSCKSLWFWSSCLLLNFNLHTAHHLYPWVPWSGLPEVHRKLLQKLPALRLEQETRNELAWSLRNRRRSLLKIMGPYFDRIPRGEKLGVPLQSELRT
jgi:omega-6 fatty acid desaturase (delta-12 desaturase)